MNMVYLFLLLFEIHNLYNFCMLEIYDNNERLEENKQDKNNVVFWRKIRPLVKFRGNNTNVTKMI